MVATRRASAWPAVRWILGLVLLAAAGLKAHQLATQPTAETSVLASRPFLIAWLLVETALGLWLCSGLSPRAGFLAAVACFALFSAVTLWKAACGETSCGCFGAIEVNPWHTLALDILAVAAAVAFHPDLRARAPVPRARARLAVALCLWLALGAPAALLAAIYRPAALSPEGRIVGDSQVVVLEPQTWLGQPWPLLGHIDVGNRLGRGRWTVVLFRDGCPHCREGLPQYRRRAMEEDRRGGPLTAFIELPPYAPATEAPPDAGAACLSGRVSDARDWFIETPTILVLSDGLVLEARQGDWEPPAAPAAEVAPVAAEVAPVAVVEGPEAQPVEVAGGQFNFGFVEPGSTHKALLALRNPSDQPLAVRQVRSECKCMTAHAPDQPAPPGGPILLQVTFDAPDKPVDYNQRLILQTDSPRHPTLAVRVRADVGRPLAAEPSPLELAPLASGEPAEATVVIRNRGLQAVRLIYSTAGRTGCFARLPRDPVPPLGALSVPVVVTADGRGPQKITLQIRTDSAGQPSLDVQIKVRAPPDGRPLS